MSVSDMEEVPCNLCGQSNPEPFSKIGQFGLPAHVVLCRNCGLMYLNPRWTRERYEAFYTNEYDDYYRPKVVNPVNQKGEPNPICERLKYLKFADRTVRSILDIGAGAGENLEAVAAMYPSAKKYAIEPSPKAVAVLESNGADVISRNIDSAWERSFSGKFDFVLMRHVLEHVADPLEALSKIATVISEGGLFYIAVPNNMKPKGCLETYWYRAVHTYYYGQTTLDFLCRKAGLEPLLVLEGDRFSPHELIFVVTPNPNLDSPTVDTRTYEAQRSVITNHLAKQNSFTAKLAKSLRKWRSILKR